MSTAGLRRDNTIRGRGESCWSPSFQVWVAKRIAQCQNLKDAITYGTTKTSNIADVYVEDARVRFSLGKPTIMTGYSQFSSGPPGRGIP